MANWQHSPPLNYSYNLLKDIGQQQTETGKSTTEKGVTNLDPVLGYFRKLLSGDTTELMSAIQPEADTISQQFNQVRRMISAQPRGGGKTSALAQEPVQQIGLLSNLLSNVRRNAATGLSDTATKLADIGLTETGMGLQGSQAAGNIALAGRGQDLGHQSFWSRIGERALNNLVDALI